MCWCWTYVWSRTWDHAMEIPKITTAKHHTGMESHKCERKSNMSNHGLHRRSWSPADMRTICVNQTHPKGQQVKGNANKILHSLHNHSLTGV